MSTPAACGRDGSRIGIEFLGKGLERGVVRCADDVGQLGMRERERGCGRRHVRCVVGRRNASEARMLTVRKSVRAGTRKFLKMGIFEDVGRLVSSIDKNRVAKSELTKL